MNKYLLGFLAIIVLLISSFSVGYCSREKETIEVVKKIHLPPLKGKTNTVYLPKPYPVKELKDTIIYQDKVVEVSDKELIQKYLALNSKYDQLLVYNKATEINDSHIITENDTIRIDNYIRTQGIVKEFKQTWEVKERSVDVTIPTILPKKDNFGLVAGGKYNIDIDTKKPSYEILGGTRIGNVHILLSGNTNRQVGIGGIIEF